MDARCSPLGPRLAAVASRVLGGAVLVDVATDHAHLPCALVSCGHVPSAIAIDIASAPLAAARSYVEAVGLAERVQLRLGDGFGPLRAGEAATAVVAGVGVETCLRMLEAPVVSSLRRLVLAPHGDLRGWMRLRGELKRLGLRLVDELCVVERDRPYLIAVVRPGVSPPCEGADAWLGPRLRRRRDAATEVWFRRELAKLEHAAARARGTASGDDAVELMNEPTAHVRSWLRLLVREEGA